MGNDDEPFNVLRTGMTNQSSPVPRGRGTSRESISTKDTGSGVDAASTKKQGRGIQGQVRYGNVHRRPLRFRRILAADTAVTVALAKEQAAQLNIIRGGNIRPRESLSTEGCAQSEVAMHDGVDTTGPLNGP